jgi:cell division protease FtsH
VVISPADFESARDRIVLGRRDRGTVLLPGEKRLVAVHEAGHAIVAAVCEDADPVAKVSILPAGMALGVTKQLPVEERHLSTEAELRAALAVRLGGRAAEQLVVGSRSSGAANDLASATDIAVRMVREFGLSEVVGPVSYVDPMPDPLGRPSAGRPCAQATLELIDRQVAELLREAESRATDVLAANRGPLAALVARLLEHEVVDGAEVYELLGRDAPAAVVTAGRPAGDVQPAGTLPAPLGAEPVEVGSGAAL